MVRSLILYLLLTVTLRAETIPGTVVAVFDGDTIEIRADAATTRIRLYGIDSPEKGQAYWKASKQALSDLVFKKLVSVEVLDTDRYGRTIGRVSVDGKDVNLAQVQTGMAWWYEKYAPDDAAMKAAQDQAKANQLGLWKDKEPIAPWEWRKKKV